MTDAAVMVEATTTTLAGASEPKVGVEPIVATSGNERVVAQAMLTLSRRLVSDESIDGGNVLKRRQLPQR